MDNIEESGEVDRGATEKQPTYYDFKTRTERHSDRTSLKSKLTAAILCWFLGGFGIHRLYIGRNASGLVMMAIGIWGVINIINVLDNPLQGDPFITFFPVIVVGVWATIDFITIVCDAMTDGEGDLIKE